VGSFLILMMPQLSGIGCLVKKTEINKKPDRNQALKKAAC
jgi:hypothetical protein